MAEDQRLGLICSNHGLSYEHVFGKSVEPFEKYLLISSPCDASDLKLQALRLTRFGRFGNNLIQIINAVHIARHLGVLQVIAFPGQILNYRSAISDGIVTILPPDAPDPPGNVLAGPFFHRQPFGRMLDDLDGPRMYEVIKTFVRPILPPALSIDRGVAEDDLVIHIRAGDLFLTRPPPSRWYRQPPLAYYQLVIAHAWANFGCRRVWIVYEDRGNPCVAGLETYLAAEGIPFIAQSGDLLDDIGVIFRGRTVALGIGTFGWAIAMLSDSIRNIYTYEMSDIYRALRAARQARVLNVRDAGGGFIRNGDWANTDEQLALMLSYPVGKLVLDPDKSSR